jgi:glycosyltransferase involved in cell wall biosynthesis
MNCHPLVSAIVTVYNYERYVGEAVESVLAQDSGPLEVVVVDDGSTDGSAAVVRGFGDRVRYGYQPNGGLCRALNHGLGLARGEFIAFLDADDLWTPDKLRVQMAAFEARPELDLVFGHARHFFSPEMPAESRRRYQCPEGTAPAYFKQAMLARRAAFARVGPFDTGLRLGDFIDWLARAREAGLKSLMLPDLVLRRRIHGANATIRQRDDKAEYLRVVRGALERRRREAGRAEA